MWGIIKKIALFILGLILLVFIGWGAYNYTRGSKYTKKENKNYDWANIHEKFENNSFLKSEWEEKGFAYPEVKDWISAGLKPQDANFAAWLRDIKKVDSDWVLNEGDDEELRGEHQKLLQEKKTEATENKLTDILNKIKQAENIWETHDFYEDFDDIVFVNPNANQTKLINEIRVEFLLKLIKFCQQLEQGELRLEDLYKSYLEGVGVIKLESCIKIGEENNQILKESGNYDEETYQKYAAYLTNLREKNKNGVNGRLGVEKEKTKIPLEILEKVPHGLEEKEIEHWIREETEGILEVENDKIIIPLKVKKFVSGAYWEQKWGRAGREYAAYTIETPTIATSWKEGKKIKITDLGIVWKDENNEIPDIDNIFQEGANIKLRLTKNPEVNGETGRIDWQLLEEGDWKEEGNDTFSLEVFSNYEIISSDRITKFN